MAIKPNLKKKEISPDLLDPTPEESDSDLSTGLKKPTGNFNKIVVGSVAVALVVLVVIFAAVYFKGGDGPPAENAEQGAQVQEQGQAPAEVAVDGDKPWLNASTQTTEPATPAEELTEGSTEGSTEAPAIGDVVQDTKGITPGITDIEQNTVNVNNTKITPDTFTKDLNSKPIAEEYKIDSIYTTIDFISYTKKRATSDDGIELYWLDAEYKGKKAKVQVPFSIFKELDPVGVTVVEVEVVRVDTGDYSKPLPEVVTGFTVRPDYKRILEQNK